MKEFSAANYGISPEKPCGKELNNLLKLVSEIDGEKIINLQKGDYFIRSCDLEEQRLVITNTAGDNEYSNNEIPHIAKVGLYFSGIDNLVFNGNGSRIIIDGQMTNIAAENCKNLTVKNIEILPVNPDMHKLTVKDITSSSVKFEIDSQSDIRVIDGDIYFIGTDYCRKIDERAHKVGYIPLVREKTPNKTERTHHPFRNYKAINLLDNKTIAVTYDNTSRFEINDEFYIYNDRRTFAGIFANNCEKIELKNVKQRFNYSLAFAAQCCDTITLDSVEFAPNPGSERKIASLADFIQVCMCKGGFNVINCVFEGAGDDCMNVHGVHYRIIKSENNYITVKYMHPQTHGFNPFNANDSIAVIDSRTLLEKDTAKVLKSKLINEYEIELELDKNIEFKEKDCVENITLCPDVYFSHNTVNRIITRGLLLTTRGKITIENNRFVCCSASGILISDDANNWYESGMCRNVIIKDNTFEYCGETPIIIKPENAEHKGAVHSNISVLNNKFINYPDCCIRAYSTDNLTVVDNSFANNLPIETVNCTNVNIR